MRASISGAATVIVQFDHGFYCASQLGPQNDNVQFQKKKILSYFCLDYCSKRYFRKASEMFKDMSEVKILYPSYVCLIGRLNRHEER